MANSRIMLVCKHCGENFCIGKGYYGSYSTCNDELHKQLNIFYNKHEHGCCSDDTDCSDNARNHFAILEEGETLAVLDADVVPKREVEMLQGALKAEERHNELTMEMAQKALANAKAEVAREAIDEAISVLEEKCLLIVASNGTYCLGKEDVLFWLRTVAYKLEKKYTENIE